MKKFILALCLITTPAMAESGWTCYVPNYTILNKLRYKEKFYPDSEFYVSKSQNIDGSFGQTIVTPKGRKSGTLLGNDPIAKYLDVPCVWKDQ